MRAARSRPLVEAIKPWLEQQLSRAPPRRGLAEAIRFALARWPAFVADAILDVTRRDEIVLDCLLGLGSTPIAAHCDG